MPAPAMNPIMEVAVKNAPIKPCAGRIPTSEKGMATSMASPVTAAVPAIRARMPYSGASSSAGYQ